MYKKIKDEKLQSMKDQDISSALSKLEGSKEGLVDEDQLIDELIKRKHTQIKEEDARPKQPEQSKTLKNPVKSQSFNNQSLFQPNQQQQLPIMDNQNMMMFNQQQLYNDPFFNNNN